MSHCRVVTTLCLLIIAISNVCNGLMLDRLPRHIPLSKDGFNEDGVEDDDLVDTYDTSIEKKKLLPEPEQIAPYLMKPTWKAIYPFTQEKKMFRKRAASEHSGDVKTSEKDKEELANILKDDDEDDSKEEKKKKSVKKNSTSRHLKKKRQSEDEPDSKQTDDEEQEQEEPKKTENFQEWLRKEYYRNMAKSFATMRRKRDGSGGYPMALPVRRQKKSIQPSTSINDITDNLRNIEDQLFQDALQVMRDSGDEYEDDVQRQNRISNDLNLAYDLETMRNAFFRLRDTLSNMENEEVGEEEDMYHMTRKRSGECPPLDQLTSDCSALSDIMPEGPLKRLLRRACNWHEVCYTCGKAYGLTSESCDGSFIEQTQTICRGDAPCESTASLLVVPLRQRRVFYKRSNPEICVEEPCVEAYLKEGLAAMEQGLYSIRNNLNTIRHA
ncbi:uncharacterized protein DDB_G0279979 [Parasteatoda tepidariorum]|uniref:uncharacterized protein DDB_G0279979 n=1 Tax=Parasteatoda tepidariorum TaxID=114398 RepID=UPI00077FC978|nr:uncharacterized protein LOC107437913 [Parasteatoda tepidariorum]